jgi:hypothetical protein
MPESEGTTRLRIAREQLSAEKIRAEIDLIKELTRDFKDVIVELLRVGASHPLVGFMITVVTVDVLNRLKIIDEGTALLVDGVASAVIGGDAAASIITSLTDAIPKFGAGAAVPDVAKPSGQVFVYGGDSGKTAEIVSALLKALPGK